MSAADPPGVSGAAKARDARPRAGLLAELLADGPATLAAAFLLLLAATAALAPVLAPYDPAAPALLDRLAPPAWLGEGTRAHLLGTDTLGRDVLSRVIWGARTSLVVGAAVVAVAGSAGVALGLVAGYAGGRADAVIMRVADMQLSFPDLLLALTVLTIIGPSPATVILILSVGGWMVYARVIRGIVLGVREQGYVEAARLIGARPGRIITHHVLPNLGPAVLTLAIVEFARIILAEAALSFLGMGIQPPATSWGLDIAAGREQVFGAWWLVTFPGLAIALTILSANVLSTWIAATTNPEERERRFARRAARLQSRGRR